MSTTSVARHSPVSSPLGTSSHRHAQQKASRPSTARITTPSGSSLPTPRPNTKRHQSAMQSQARADSSPNYFNLTIDSAKTVQSSAGDGHAHTNFSPPSSRVRSTAAISPRVMPLDQNPDFAEFKRQSDLRFAHNGGFNFTGPNSQESATSSIRMPSSNPRSPPLTSPTSRRGPTALETILQSSEKPRSPKRTLSSPYTDITDGPRRNSPASFTDRETANAPNTISFLADDYVNFSLPPTARQPPLPASHASIRADTLPIARKPAPGESLDGPPFATVSDVAALLETYSDDVMLLDLRVSTLYARSRIQGALNLCIPTTLLKRSSYNTSRLAETFNRSLDQKTKFERWRSCKYIIVYDASASKAKDALSCVNMLKKFASEGWAGSSYIIRGGFVELSRSYPNMVEYGGGSLSGSESPPASSMSSGGHSLAPVIGGCPMPASKDVANPFFSNIRQNMDLIGGVGQIPVLLPPTLNDQRISSLPTWLQEVAKEKDSGKSLANKFKSIEVDELHRMREALARGVKVGGVGGEKQCIEIAGVEKGSKNRYNNIWPFEHTRVKLEGVAQDACDYINANHVKASWSNKRYIATQGPIPATFNDFWNVVWQQDVRVIVMLTAEMESGQIKAHNYWSDKQFGHLRLKFLSENKASLEPAKIHAHKSGRPSTGPRRSTTSVLGQNSPKPEASGSKSDAPYVTVRRFTLSNTQEPFERMREITHLQYSNWPDFGAPAHPAHLLGLVEQCDRVVRSTKHSSSNGPASSDARPIVVHCSAGCGRTGTFCTVDSVLDMIKRQRAHQTSNSRSTGAGEPMEGVKRTGGSRSDSSDSVGDDVLPTSAAGREERHWLEGGDIDLVHKTVAEFRTQRLSMVQSLRQFVLCYESVLEWLTEQSPKSA